MMYDAIIFDLDGTLLDTVEDLADSANATLVAFECDPYPVKDYHFFVGDGLLGLVKKILPEEKLTPEIIEQFAVRFKEEYALRWNKKTVPYEGVPAMLDAIKEIGIPTAILSNKPDEFTQRCVNDLLPDWTFNIVLGQTLDFPKKPDPASAWYLAQRLNVHPKRVLYVGDTGTDMQTAKNAGFYPVGVLWGFRPQAELEANGAETLIAKPGELLDLLQ
jgi:phosphoglycolate phosphatase